MKPKITEIEILPIKPQEGLIAFASCLFDDKLSLNSIAIYTRADGSGYRLSYPNKILRNGKEITLFYPISQEIGKAIEDAIIKKFEELMEKVRRKNGDNRFDGGSGAK